MDSEIPFYLQWEFFFYYKFNGIIKFGNSLSKNSGNRKFPLQSPQNSQKFMTKIPVKKYQSSIQLNEIIHIEGRTTQSTKKHSEMSANWKPKQKIKYFFGIANSWELFFCLVLGDVWKLCCIFWIFILLSLERWDLVNLWNFTSRFQLANNQQIHEPPQFA